ncbi:MAG: 23S rRNA (guanosine(2251)-2'-O)-methyltransferase RlmB [Nitrospira sp. SB0677_bin_15]|nr:23S rRNA (guanosine(2251)-2'-O)-methyltransferase RlmB [Nitrospira sp. SB0677_bin_15]MYH02932.1 23S rRNA (guanosine(2251)-2'-O)-methyltransferase RlmB [Nitrospira sp. SB0675_bin_23]
MFGVQAVTEALRSGSRTFIKIFLSHRQRQFSHIIRFAKVQGVPLQVQPRERLDRLVPAANHQGVVALVAAKAYASEDEILEYAAQQKETGFFLALDGVEDPQNFGAVLRTAVTAGIHGVFIPDRRSVGLTASVAKASAGAVEHVRVARCANIAKLIDRLQGRGVTTVALEPRSPRLYTELNFTGPVLLVFGGEGRGLRSRIVERCHVHARIPMRGEVNSLNVSASVAVVAYEVVRQRM